jgi:hypothetical protein
VTSPKERRNCRVMACTATHDGNYLVVLKPDRGRKDERLSASAPSAFRAGANVIAERVGGEWRLT